MRTRLASCAVTSTLVTSLLVAAAPSATADIGDMTRFPLPSGVSSFEMMSAADGSLWLSPFGGTSLVNLSMAGNYTLHPVTLLGKPVEGAGIAQAPDGRIWFAERTSPSIISTDSAGNDARQFFPTGSSAKPNGVAVGSDGNVWFTTPTSIRRMTPTGQGTTFETSFKNISNIVAGPGNGLAFGAVSTHAVGRITTDGVLSKTALPDNAYQVAVGPDGTIWVGGPTAVYRVSPSEAVSTFDVKTSGGSAIAVAPDGSAWAAGMGDNSLSRIGTDGKITKFTVKDTESRDIALGADGNMWVLSSTAVTRVLTGVTPTNTTAPAISAPANTSGTALTADNGRWKYLPTSFDQQWQRCTSNDPGSCTDIGGATKANYTITGADLGGFVRVNVSAKNLNGSSKPAGSTLFQVAPKPTAPTQPTNPTPTTPAPVSGVGKATIATGVTAALSGPSSVKRKAKRTYRVTFSTPQPRGSVTLSLLNSAGAEAYVITAGADVKGTRKIAFASKTARIPRSVPKGAYTLVAVYTPAATQVATYPIATITKPLRLR